LVYGKEHQASNGIAHKAFRYDDIGPQNFANFTRSSGILSEAASIYQKLLTPMLLA
jgi:hypothetical protein